MIETWRKTTTGEYSGISAFTHNYNHFNIEYKDEEEARKILELVRYANVHKQLPLVKEKFVFIAEYPKITKKILTMILPDISIERLHYKIARKHKSEINDLKQVKAYIKK